MFQGFLHSHLAGRKMRVRHIRNLQELPTLLEDNNYDFNYQYAKGLREKEVDLLPGDELLIECDYASLDRKNFSFGGSKFLGGFLIGFTWTFNEHFRRINLTRNVLSIHILLSES